MKKKKTKRKLRNEFERKVAAQIKRNGHKVTYEAERIPYVRAHHYLTDFTIDTPLGKILIETKGYFRADDKAKLRAVKKQHPELDLRILFYRADKKNIRWAERNGFRYAVSSIPLEWFEGL